MNKHLRGGALPELLAVMSVLVFFAFGTFEFTNMLDRAKLLSNLTREAANAAKRDCSFGSAAVVQDCLNKTAAKVLEAAEILRPQRGISTKGIRINYWSDTSPGNNDRPGAPIAGGAGLVGPTKFTQTVVDNNSDFKTIFNEQQCVVVSEAYYSYEPVTPFLAAFLGRAAGMNEQLYDWILF